jgi:flagellar motor component MotA
MNKEKEVNTESDIKSEPFSAESMAQAWKILNGIKVIEDKFMPENMAILVNGKKEIQWIIDFANEETNLHKENNRLKAEIDQLKAENERLLRFNEKISTELIDNIESDDIRDYQD